MVWSVCLTTNLTVWGTFGSCGVCTRRPATQPRARAALGARRNRRHHCAAGAGLGSCPRRIATTVAFPRYLGVLLAAPHTAPAGTHAGITGCSPGSLDALQAAVGSESLVQPRTARSRCSPRPWELFGATHLHNRDACAIASPLGYKLFRGLRRYRIRSKNGEFPHIPPSHPCRRKGSGALHEEGNWDGSRAAGEEDRLPAVTNPWHGRLPTMTTRGTGAEPLLPRGTSPRPHVATLGRRGHQTVRKPRDVAETRARCWPPPSLAALAGVGLRAGTALHGTAGYARNVPNASGLDCGRSGRRAADESLGGLAAARRSR